MLMKIIGHRGARGLSSENTAASFDTAIKHGVDEIEIDVRVTRDGVAVLHHDEMLTDPDGREVSIARTTYAELMRHNNDLMALDHAIRHIAHRCRIMLEIKPSVPTKQVTSIIRDRLKRGWLLEEFAIASLDFSILKQMRHEFPDVELVVVERWSGVRARYRMQRLGTKRVSMNQRWLWRGFLRGMHRGGYLLTPYTVNSVRRARKWRPYIYGIITDRPDLFQHKKTR